MEIILASNSPRRKELLEKAGYKFEIISSDYDEKINGLNYSDSLVENCAYQKALDVRRKTNSEKIIVSADTVVVLDNIILGKPKDKQEAKKMLTNLSGKTHFVATSICLIKDKNTICATAKTYVTFKKLKEEEIINYIETKNPLDKAGSYGIQDEGFDFALKIDGYLDNVIGFPTLLFKELLSKLII